MSAYYSGQTTLLQLKGVIDNNPDSKNTIDSDTIDLSDFVKNVGGLSDYYLRQKGEVRQAHHLLEACKYVIERYKHVDGDGDECVDGEVEETRVCVAAENERKIAGILLQLLEIASEVFAYKQEVSNLFFCDGFKSYFVKIS